jgi:hypothetical protein
MGVIFTSLVLPRVLGNSEYFTPILKLKAVPLHATKALGGRGCIAPTHSTSALDGCDWSASRPGRALALGKGPPVPTVREAGWAPEPVWAQRLEEKSFRFCRGSNLDRPVVQPVARHYTDCATRLTYAYTETCKTIPLPNTMP